VREEGREGKGTGGEGGWKRRSSRKRRGSWTRKQGKQHSAMGG